MYLERMNFCLLGFIRKFDERYQALNLTEYYLFHSNSIHFSESCFEPYESQKVSALYDSNYLNHGALNTKIYSFKLPALFHGQELDIYIFNSWVHSLAVNSFNNFLPEVNGLRRL
jgi:hypothetical protein